MGRVKPGRGRDGRDEMGGNASGADSRESMGRYGESKAG